MCCCRRGLSRFPAGCRWRGNIHSRPPTPAHEKESTMLLREYAGHGVDVNEEGFLLDASQWTPEVAVEIAREVGIDPLTPRHWKVLTFCREDAARSGAPPGLRRIAKLS